MAVYKYRGLDAGGKRFYALGNRHHDNDGEVPPEKCLNIEDHQNLPSWTVSE